MADNSSCVAMDLLARHAEETWTLVSVMEDELMHRAQKGFRGREKRLTISACSSPALRYQSIGLHVQHSKVSPRAKIQSPDRIEVRLIESPLRPVNLLYSTGVCASNLIGSNSEKRAVLRVELSSRAMPSVPTALVFWVDGNLTFAFFPCYHDRLGSYTIPG